MGSDGSADVVCCTPPPDAVTGTKCLVSVDHFLKQQRVFTPVQFCVANPEQKLRRIFSSNERVVSLLTLFSSSFSSLVL